MDEQKVLEDILQSNVEFENGITTLSFENGVGNLTVQLKRFLLEMKMQVDRWDLIVDTYVFHTSVKSAVLDILFKDLDLQDDEYSLWGAKLYFIDSVPQNNVFAFDLANKHRLVEMGVIDNRYASKGVLSTTELERFLKLKVFW